MKKPIAPVLVDEPPELVPASETEFNIEYGLRDLINAIILNFGDVRLSQVDWNKIEVETENDYSGCYYSGDTPSISVSAKISNPRMIPNPDYENLLYKFRMSKDRYEKQLVIYREEMKKYNNYQDQLILEKAEKIRSSRNVSKSTV